MDGVQRGGQRGQMKRSAQQQLQRSQAHASAAALLQSCQPAPLPPGTCGPPTPLPRLTSYPTTLPPLLAGSGQPSVTEAAVVSQTKGASQGAQDATVACV